MLLESRTVDASFRVRLGRIVSFPQRIIGTLWETYTPESIHETHMVLVGEQAVTRSKTMDADARFAFLFDVEAGVELAPVTAQRRRVRFETDALTPSDTVDETALFAVPTFALTATRRASNDTVSIEDFKLGV